MNCHDCKVPSCDSAVDDGDCPIEERFNEFLQHRDEINNSDRGKVFYACADDPEEPDECLYGTEGENDCTHLASGKHPRDCNNATLKVNETTPKD